MLISTEEDGLAQLAVRKASELTKEEFREMRVHGVLQICRPPQLS